MRIRDSTINQSDNSNWKVALTPYNGISVVGYVCDETGWGVPQQQLRISADEKDTSRAVAISDENGKFVFDSVIPFERYLLKLN
ncbi:MAG: protocatechuate 3,4-dioxygenase beta subunit [Saprospiraceae bacterium]